MATAPLTEQEVQRLVEQKALELRLQDKLEETLEKHLSKTERKLARRTTERLTPKMRERRDRFIAEFLVDFNGPAAVVRTGGSPASAAKVSSELQREPYVQERLREAMAAMEESKLLDRKRILAGFIREANYQGHGASHGARVQAWKALADIAGMEAPKTVKNEHMVKGGVMVVPLASSLEEWEQTTEQDQSQLKKDVRT